MVKATEDDVHNLQDLCSSIQSKVDVLFDLFGSQPLEDWQVFGATHLLGELDEKLETIYKTLTAPKKVANRSRGSSSSDFNVTQRLT